MAQCKESICIYGVPGAGKTTQAQELAKYVHRKLGKKIRLASTSGGGWTSIQPAIDIGIIVPAYLRGRDHAVETMDQITRGYWPENVDDPKSPMLPPDKQKDYGDIGGYVFDGITESADWMMEKLNAAEARGEIKISALSIRFQDGKTQYGSPAMAHYGLVQSRITGFIAQSRTLADMYLLWTALELKATDDNSRLPLYGPDVIGRAKTASSPAMFANTLHLYLTGAGGLKKGPVIRRLYLTTHFEDDGIPYLAKNRGHYYAPLPEYLEGKDCSLYVFLEKLEESYKEASAKLTQELKVT